MLVTLELSHIAVGNVNGVATLRNSLKVPQKVKHKKRKGEKKCRRTSVLAWTVFNVRRPSVFEPCHITATIYALLYNKQSSDMQTNNKQQSKTLLAR